MGKLVVSEFLTVDGIMEAPEKWNSNYLKDEEITNDILANLSASNSILFGRATYQFFAARWPARTGELADKFKNLPKYVVSSTLQKAEWNNSVTINANINGEIIKIKKQSKKNILVLGSYKLVRTLMKDNLVDEFKLYMFPLLLGTGKRLFDKETAGQPLKLINARIFSSGAIEMAYQPGKNI
jgi:dihydrofolate reductase